VVTTLLSVKRRHETIQALRQRTVIAVSRTRNGRVPQDVCTALLAEASAALRSQAFGKRIVAACDQSCDIAPGYMATDKMAPIRADLKREREILSRVPMDRRGTPEDLRGAVVSLASRASDYITGTIVRVDGGWLTR
jgi:hypothetical protein